MSDNSGAIVLRKVKSIPAEIRLTLSHISFRDSVIVVSLPLADDLQVKLRLDNVALPEINVVGGKPRKFKSPKHLLRMAIKAKKKNYPDKLTLRTRLSNLSGSSRSLFYSFPEGSELTIPGGTGVFAVLFVQSLLAHPAQSLDDPIRRDGFAD